MKIVSNLFKKANPRPIRSSRRLPIKIRFIVRGRDTSGHVFTTAGETTLVSNNGGRLLFDKDVNEGQNLKLADPNGMSFWGQCSLFRLRRSEQPARGGFQGHRAP
ncbi:MAG TPA: hypothetical protein VFQ43_05795 [Nitrososphaera sp.]|nr:hypothetical protein [Nitrososphaera sp.]